MSTMPVIALLLLAAPQEAARTATTTVKLTATATYQDGTTRIIDAVSDRDSDNDGINDRYEIRVTCTGTTVSSASLSPRDSSTGLATGKRMHKPMTITKELDKSPPLASGRVGGVSSMDDWSSRVTGHPVASWDLATAKGGRMAAPAFSAANVDPLVCASH